MSPNSESPDGTIIFGVLSNAAWHILQKIWAEANNKSWGELYIDSFRLAIEDIWENWSKYTPDDHVIDLAVDRFLKVLSQDLRVDIDTITFDELNDREYKDRLCQAMVDRSVLIIGGHTLTNEDYSQLVHNLILQAQGRFRESIEKNQEAFNHALLGMSAETRDDIKEIKKWIFEAHKTHSSSIPIPLQKPPRAEHFTGRETELAKLLNELQPGKVVTLCGPGGIGKTALAVEVIWSLAPGDEPPVLFPDGIIFYSFYGKPDIALAFEHIIRSFDENARDFSADGVMRLLSRKKAILLLDGVEEASDIRTLLDECCGRNCGVFVTSRMKAIPYGELFEVKPLKRRDSIILLKKLGGKWAADETADREIITLVGGLALAVRLVGAYLSQHQQKSSEYLEWLRTSPLQALDQGKRRQDSVATLLRKSIGQVSEGARDVLGLIGHLALAPFSAEVIGAGLDISLHEARHQLGELINFEMLHRGKEHYQVSHPMIYVYARGEIKPVKIVLERVADYYKDLLRKETVRGLDGYQHLDVDRPHILKSIEGCADYGNWALVIGLVDEIDYYLDFRGYWTERVNALEMGLKASQQTSNRPLEHRYLGELGYAYRVLGQVWKAIDYLEKALAIARETNNRRLEVHDISGLGDAYSDLGQLDKGIEYYEQALAIARESGNREGEGVCLGDIGTAYRELGQVEKAVEYYEKALVIFRETRNRRSEGVSLGNLGIAYKIKGDFQSSISYFEQALIIFREIRNRRSEGIVLNDLSLTQKSLNEIQKAINNLEQALTIFQDIDDRRNEGIALGNLGSIYRDLRQVNRAIEYYEKALLIFEELRLPNALSIKNIIDELRIKSHGKGGE